METVTKREALAAVALHGILVLVGTDAGRAMITQQQAIKSQTLPQAIADAAVSLADEMIKRLKQ